MKRDLDTWWDWRAATTTTGDEDSSISPEAALELLVQKCVVLDNLSPVSYVHTIRTALEQFGKVRGVKLVRDCQTCLFTGVAFAEMESKEQRDQVVKELKDYLLMIGQMPRPARAIPACPELMIDHPLRSFSRKVSARLVTPKNPRYAQLRETAIQENIHYAHQSALIQVLLHSFLPRIALSL